MEEPEMKRSKQSKALSLILALTMVFALFTGVGSPAVAATATINIGYHITTNGEYQIDQTAANGTIYVDTNAEVTLIGSGATASSVANKGLTISATVPDAKITLQDIWIAEPYNGGSILDFTGTGNELSSVGANILDSQTYGNGAAIHVGKGDVLAITGTIPTNPNNVDDRSGLYIFSSSYSSAIGGNEYEASGSINFIDGNTYVKGADVGAVIGGDGVDASNPNDSITVSGGQLSIFVTGRGAGIGSSNQGQCAGNVFLLGGSTLINVDFSGSAIGHGASGSNGGYLYATAGSLKVVIDKNAGLYWGTSTTTDTVSNVAITAKKLYGSLGSTTSADVAAVDISGLAPLTSEIDAEVTLYGASTTTTFYKQNGLDRNKYNPATTVTYTPLNWQADATADSMILYLYLPTDSIKGTITVSEGLATPLEFTYSYNGSSFDVYLGNPATVSFAASPPGSATFYVNGTSVTQYEAATGGGFDFSVVPTSGNVISGTPSSTAGIITGGNGGIYHLANATTGTITVSTITGTTYNVAFNHPNSTIYVNGDAVTSSIIVDTTGTLDFTVATDAGYGVSSVTTNNGTISYNPATAVYTLSNVTSAPTVTVNTTTSTNTVTFVGQQAVAVVNNVTVLDSTTVPTGGTLYFKVQPYLGYDVATVTAGGTAVPQLNGYYYLQNVTSNTTVTITTSGDKNYWTSVTTGTWAGNGTVDTPYIISDDAGLAKLLNDVNGGNTYANTYFKLGAGISLANDDLLWAPIGGGAPVSNGVLEDAPYFAGSFDGAGFTISDLTISASPFVDGFGGYGLFGYVKDGSIQNLTVSGSITFNNNSVYAVGGIVGYTTGSVYNSTNSVAISIGTSAGDATTTVGTGGIAGVVDNLGGVASYIQLCNNTAAITGRSRLGGVVGAAYATVQGGVVIDQVANTGALTGTNSSGRAYVGGVVGYTEGYVQHSYNQGNISVGTGNYYVGGVARVRSEDVCVSFALRRLF
jgi:hypothetical protein